MENMQVTRTSIVCTELKKKSAKTNWVVMLAYRFNLLINNQFNQTLLNWFIATEIDHYNLQ